MPVAAHGLKIPCLSRQQRKSNRFEQFNFLHSCVQREKFI